MNCRRTIIIAWGICLVALSGAAQVPALLNYQGRLAVNGADYTGAGQFKFALVSNNGGVVLWQNAPDSNGDGQPDTPVNLSVNGGLFSVYLGDTSLPGMGALPIWVFTNAAVNLRIWANDGTHGMQRLAPDQPLGAAGYAMMAANVPDAAITPAKLAPGTTTAVTATLTAQIALLITQLQTLSIQINTVSNQYGSTLAAGLTMASPDPQDAVLSAQGFKSFASLAAPGWMTSSAEGTPAPRSDQAGLWTGQELMIWGGALAQGGEAISGGRYRPDLDLWQPISTVNVPPARKQHTAVWSGQEMLVWGGFGGGAYLNTGGRYNPVSQLWAGINPTNAPVGRVGHVAVWTGSRLMVWGGRNSNGLLGDGSLYDPLTDQWSPLNLANAPAVRSSATGVWIGNGVIIWGGVNELGSLNSGALLSVAGNGLPTSWRALSATKSPSSRIGHVAVWTGRKLLVWGGKAGGQWLGDGAAYDPVIDAWSAITAVNAPAARSGHGAVWTGQEMLIFGGETLSGTTADGAAYDPATDKWRPLSSAGGPQPRSGATLAWSGSELVVFAGIANGQPLAALQRLNPQPNWYLYRKP